jgi:hypothetical protein
MSGLQLAPERHSFRWISAHRHDHRPLPSFHCHPFRHEETVLGNLDASSWGKAFRKNGERMDGWLLVDLYSRFGETYHKRKDGELVKQPYPRRAKRRPGKREAFENQEGYKLLALSEVDPHGS